MAKALRQKPKPVFANGEQPPPGIDPKFWDPIADPNTDGTFSSGPDAGQADYSYGDFVTHLRQGVMAGRLTPEGISRPEASWRLSQELDHPPYLHEVGSIPAARLQMYADDGGHRGAVRRGASKLAEVRAAYDLTEDEYQRWLAERDNDNQED